MTLSRAERRRRTEARRRVLREFVEGLEARCGPLTPPPLDADDVEWLRRAGSAMPPLSVQTLRTGHVEGCVVEGCAGWPCVPPRR